VRLRSGPPTAGQTIISSIPLLSDLSYEYVPIFGSYFEFHA